MRRRDLLTIAAAPLATPKDTTRTFHHENVLGTSFELRVTGGAPAKAEAATLAEIDRLASILSSYNESSEFSRWAHTRNTPVRVSPELLDVLGLYDTWRARTGGALNAAFSAAPQAAAQPHWLLNPASGTAIRLTDTPLVLNSFTKSYIIDRAANAALAHAPGVVLNIGGDLAIRGRVTETVHLANPADDTENSAPLARARVANRVVATSGPSRRGAHIIDPRTGTAPSHILSSTVVSPDAIVAGALATAFTILSPAASRALAARFKDVEYMLVHRDGSITRTALFEPLAQVPPAGLEVVVNLELARIEAQRYRRPYVAVWVEDKDKFPVRTVALWFQKDRWLPDLRAWYRGDRLRLLAEGNEIAASVSSATRPPGKYTLKWDGKDNKGAPVKPGKYTVFIEAAREHGSYQLLRQEVDLTVGPKSFPLAAGEEIASASIDVRKPAGR